MKSDYELFLDYAKENNIELQLHQKQLVKTFFEGGSVIIPRQHGRRYLLEHMAEFQKELDSKK